MQQTGKKSQPKTAPAPNKSQGESYHRIQKIDGQHPWQSEVPDGCVLYPVRTLKHGSVTYFNFELAKEMGLISKSHKNEMNARLEKQLLSVFNIRIINEFDVDNKIQFDKKTIKPHQHMATRYLQLQHDCKSGSTSGDGRGIWNGSIQFRGKTWDISSRGTGVTQLAPGSVKADTPLETGNIDHGYGCGLAEIDELYSSSIMSEIMHHNGFNTERTLLVIDHGNGYGIGVRAGLNLFRPAHLFNFLKQKKWKTLRNAVDFVIDRQSKNKRWDISATGNKKYDQMLDAVVYDFARFAAQLEREYVFAWLDWDGDNVLADAGIIDYGSIRQFGVRHDQYRYDDVERFSTTLNEQKHKAGLIIQVFAQMVDYIKTKDYKPLNHFKEHRAVRLYYSSFEYFLLDRFLYQVGFNEEDRNYLLRRHRDTVKELYDDFEKLEKTKTQEKTKPVEDGVNRPAIYNMRKALHHLPEFFKKHRESDTMANDFHQLILVDEALPMDQKLSAYKKQQFSDFFAHFGKLIQIMDHYKKGTRFKCLSLLKRRSTKINNLARFTGNSLVHVVNELIAEKENGLSHKEIQRIIDQMIIAQSKTIGNTVPYKAPFPKSPKSKAIVQTMFEILDGHKEDI